MIQLSLVTLCFSLVGCPIPNVRNMSWMRRRGDKVRITSGMYESHRGTVEANVYQKTADYPNELSEGFHVMLDTEELVTVRWDQVEAAPGRSLARQPLFWLRPRGVQGVPSGLGGRLPR